MKYGLLPPSEWKLVEHIYRMHGASLPHKDLARIAIALDGDNKIQGLLTVQPVMHMEPIWISEDARGEVRFKRLVEVLDNDLNRVRGNTPMVYYAFVTPEAPAIEGMGEAVGMKVIEGWKVMQKILGTPQIQVQ